MTHSVSAACTTRNRSAYPQPVPPEIGTGLLAGMKAVKQEQRTAPSYSARRRAQLNHKTQAAGLEAEAAAVPVAATNGGRILKKKEVAGYIAKRQA